MEGQGSALFHWEFGARGGDPLSCLPLLSLSSSFPLCSVLFLSLKKPKPQPQIYTPKNSLKLSIYPPLLIRRLSSTKTNFLFCPTLIFTSSSPAITLIVIINLSVWVLVLVAYYFFPPSSSSIRKGRGKKLKVRSTGRIDPNARYGTHARL